jgi:branched-chain amino acid transport system substrate-binding protein
MKKHRAAIASTGSLVCLLVFALVTSAGAGTTTGVTDTTIKIGMFGAMTGPYYLFGSLVMNGAEIVYDEVNRAGGIHGRRIKLVREDDACKPEQGIAAVKKLIYQHKVFMIHGGGCSNPALAAREEVERANIPWVVFAAVHDGITKPVHPYIFTTAMTASKESNAQVAFALSKPGVKRIAIISQHDAWGTARYTALIEALKKGGITPVADEEMTVDANDASAQVLRLKKANPDAVIMELYPKPTAVTLRDAYKFGLKPLWVSQTAVSDLHALQKQVGIPGVLDEFFTISQVKYLADDPAIEPIRRAAKRLFPNDRLSVYNLFGYASAKAVVEVLRRAGRNLTRERFRDEFERLKDFDTGMYPGLLTCTAEDHQCNHDSAWITLHKGKLINVGAVYKRF